MFAYDLLGCFTYGSLPILANETPNISSTLRLAQHTTDKREVKFQNAAIFDGKYWLSIRK